ncbi:MAG: hypothetical protein ACOX61_08275 [Brooklawnia sp.]|jgi:hypothetical protein
MTDTNTAPEIEPTDTPDTPPEAPESTETPEQATDTFPREYVEQLRREAAEARVRAKRADDLAQALFVSRVAATGRLADPNDLPYDEAILDDPAKLDAAIDELLDAHPHYATRTPRGDIGQGPTPEPAGVDLAAILRAGA